MEKQLADIVRLSFSPDAVELLRCRFEERLERVTPEDRRFVLESLGARLIAFPDGTWDMEIELSGRYKVICKLNTAYQALSLPETIFRFVLDHKLNPLWVGQVTTNQCY